MVDRFTERERVNWREKIGGACPTASRSHGEKMSGKEVRHFLVKLVKTTRPRRTNAKARVADEAMKNQNNNERRWQ